MEAEIKRIIEADLKAQKRLQDVQTKIEEALSLVQKEKTTVQQEVWESAKLSLENERNRLQNEFEKNKAESQALYQTAIQKLELNFNQNKDVWLKNIVDHCIQEGTQQ